MFLLYPCSNAMALAHALREMKGVSRVIYPGFEDHPGYAVASRQMKGFGGMVTVEIEGGLERAKAVAERLRIFALAESLGGVESLCGHPATMSHAGLPEAERYARGITDGMLRLSVGIEDASDLIQDIQEALV